MTFKYTPGKPTLDEVALGHANLSKRDLVRIVIALAKHIDKDGDVAQKDYLDVINKAIENT